MTRFQDAIPYIIHAHLQHVVTLMTINLYGFHIEIAVHIIILYGRLMNL